MDTATVDAQYQQLQAQVTAAMASLVGKLQAAADAGDAQASTWLLGLREVAVAVQAEENSAVALVQALHDLTAGSLQAAANPGTPYPGEPGYAGPSYAPTPPSPGTSHGAQGAGALLGRLVSSGIGQAMVSGAGFGLGNDLVQGLFGRR